MRVKRARGARVNGLIDFTSGWLVANIGHDNPRVLRAVRKARGWAVLDGWENPARTAAEAELRAILPPYLDRIYLYNSGSEAMDAALRFAPGPVVAHPRAFHGSTIGAQAIRRSNIGEWLQRDAHTPSGTVLLETFLGPWCEWYPRELISVVSTLQREEGLTLIFDEMQAGFGRTGRWWGFEHYGIRPDIVVGGKAMAGGFPMAFVAGRAALLNGPSWESTFSGNALSCAACVATIREIRRRRLVERVRANEWRIREACERIAALKPEWTYDGRGFAYAVDMHDAAAAKRIVAEARQRGLLLLDTGRGTVKIAPPLSIPLVELELGLEILEHTIKTVRNV